MSIRYSKILLQCQKNISIIAKNIKKFIEKKSISQNKLSKLAGMTLNTITKIESGATPESRIESVKKIAQSLGVSVDDLIIK